MALRHVNDGGGGEAATDADRHKAGMSHEHYWAAMQGRSSWDSAPSLKRFQSSFHDNTLTFVIVKKATATAPPLSLGCPLSCHLVLPTFQCAALPQPLRLPGDPPTMANSIPPLVNRSSRHLLHPPRSFQTVRLECQAGWSSAAYLQQCRRQFSNAPPEFWGLERHFRPGPFHQGPQTDPLQTDPCPVWPHMVTSITRLKRSRCRCLHLTSLRRAVSCHGFWSNTDCHVLDVGGITEIHQSYGAFC